MTKRTNGKLEEDQNKNTSKNGIIIAISSFLSVYPLKHLHNTMSFLMQLANLLEKILICKRLGGGGSDTGPRTGV